MGQKYLRKYGVEATFDFTLYEIDGVDFKVDAVHVAGDTKIMKDEGAEANTTNAFTDEGQGYSLVLTATEMQAARIVVYVVDQGTKAWLDDYLVVETYGNASAQHAVDLNDSVRAGLTALPNAAADAVGGLPISDAGGLDLDAILADTSELQTDDVPGLIAALNDISAQNVTDDLLAEVIESGKSFKTMLLDLWAVIAGNAAADDADDPTSITYDSPDDSVQVTHALTGTSRTVS